MGVVCVHLRQIEFRTFLLEFLVPYPAGSCWKGNILGAAFITFLYSTGEGFCVGSVYCLSSIGCNILGLPSAKLLLRKSRIALLGRLCGRSGTQPVIWLGRGWWRCVHQCFCDDIFYSFIWGPGTGPSKCFVYFWLHLRMFFLTYSVFPPVSHIQSMQLRHQL